MQHPKRVVASPSPNQSPTPYNYSNAKGWSRIVQPIAVPLSDVIKQQTVSQSEQTNQIKPKGWSNTQSSFTPLDAIIDEQKHGDSAMAAGGADLPLPITAGMKLMAGVMKTLTKRV